MNITLKLSTSQLNELKSGIKNVTEVTLKILLKIVVDSNDENNFTYRILLTNTQVSRLRKAFADNIKLSNII